MYIGPFYFDKKELLLIILTIIIGFAWYFGWDIYLFDKRALLTILIMILITKGLLPAIHNEAFFILAIGALFLTLFLPIFQVVLFYFLSFLFFRVFRVI